ncbi:MAG: GNAT family N-acetyltransferase [Myxococcales bacterium]|nr:GNAT family N-acetyltransferase [Myxococcales bacterium]
MSREPRPSTIDILDQMAQDFIRRDLALHSTDDAPMDGRSISVGGKPLVNFGSCSYMGFETHPDLAEGAAAAAKRYGTQFSSSRAFISLGLYEVLEGMLHEIFQKPLLVSASTTLGHMAALPVLVRDDDAVVLDLQVHHSVQTAAQLLKARGVPLHIIRHNDMDQLERKIRQLRGKHRRVWYMADGVYSMFGDVAPMDRLTALMDQYPEFYTYIDDAHGMSWAGPKGCGVVRSSAPHHDQMVLIVSLNKAFASAGGCIVFPNDEMRSLVRNTGGTMIFCGPIQPPMLGAALASARLHLSDELPAMQQELLDLVDHCNAGLAARGLPQYQVTRSPLFFIPTGLPRVVGNLVHRILDDGYYVNMATFPATPMRQGGLRFMINRNVTKADIDGLLDRVAYHYPRALAEEGSSPAEVLQAFKLDDSEIRTLVLSEDDRGEPQAAPALQVSHHRSVAEIDGKLWDGWFAGKGNHTHAGLALLEEVFTQPDGPENQWDFHYVIVRDQAGAPVLASFFTTALVKDDMAAEGRVSQQIEAARAEDPHYLTSTVVMLGCLISKGEHLFLDRAHPEWRAALDALLKVMGEVREAAGANQILLREFEQDADPELRQHMLDQGFIELPLGNCLRVDALDWPDHDAWLAGLGGKYRYNVRKEILRLEDRFEVVFDAPWAEQEIADTYALYEAVHARSFELNVFKLPYRFFAAMCSSPDYEVMRLYLLDDPRPPLERTPAAVMFSFVGGGLYSALIIGLDEAFQRSHGSYKQALYQTVHRARALGCQRLDLAYTAELEKRKVGARPVPMVAYVQTEDLYNHTIIEAMGLEGGQ